MREEKQLCNLHVLETSHHFMQLTAYMPFIYMNVKGNDSELLKFEGNGDRKKSL